MRSWELGPHDGIKKESEKVKSLSRVRLFATPWTVAYQAPLSMGFSRQDYWTDLPYFLLQGILLTQGLNVVLPHCRRTLYPLSHQGSPHDGISGFIKGGRERSPPSCPVPTDQGKTTWAHAEKVTTYKKAFTGTWIKAYTVILHFPVSRTMRNKPLL